jgi:UDP-GlcNAc3NAcA epimerase
VRVLTVIGNRPQFVKAAAVSARLRERADEVLVHTGQHYDHALSEAFFSELGLPAPDHLLGTGSGTHAEMTGSMMRALDPIVAGASADAVMVYGDTDSTLAGALVAAKAGIPLVHVEAGMRSFDRSMPEEVNRVVADSLTDLPLCSTEAAMRNLEAEGLGGSARLVGDVMADVALLFGPIADERSDVLERLDLEPRGYIVATAHRPANVDDPADLAALLDVLERCAAEEPVVFAVHPRTALRIQDAGLSGLEQRGIRAIEPAGYLDFAKLVRSSRAVLTDSGGLQKEAFLASVPCVTMRRETEWVETLEAGWNRLVGLDPDVAAAALAELPKPGSGAVSPAAELYGGGDAGDRVAAEMETWLASR